MAIGERKGKSVPFSNDDHPLSNYVFLFFSFPPRTPSLNSATTAPATPSPSRYMVLSVDRRQIALNLRRQGKSANQIAATVGADRRTIQRLFKHIRETGHVEPDKQPGRPRTLSPREERMIVREIRADPTRRPSTLRTVVERPGLKPVSTQTVRRTLKRAGLQPAKPRRKPKLTPAQRRARLEWAREHADKPADFWAHVIFSDETTFHLHHAMRGGYVWRYRDEELEPRFVQQVAKFGGFGLKVWACVTSRGIGYHRGLPEGLNSQTYIDILDKELRWTREYYFKDSKGVIFQQDGAGEHRSKAVKDYFQRKKVRLLPWPAHSPDLSPIENLWADVKRRLVEQHRDLKKPELWPVVQELLEETDKEYIRNLFASMPERLAAVIEKKGGHTRF